MVTSDAINKNVVVSTSSKFTHAKIALFLGTLKISSGMLRSVHPRHRQLETFSEFKFTNPFKSSSVATGEPLHSQVVQKAAYKFPQ